MASWYALTTHTESAAGALRSAAIVGRATLAIEPSRTDSVSASQIVPAAQ
jgi:hypothetical protein